ncbi:MAG: ABC transporter permease [Marinifilaceae bacterium]|jgi:putative ABC transport system permease protein|nr:ABC transporter permease [Marinifilaceae bacterium]
MFDIDKWHEILSAMKENKTRTFLTAFSVATGIFMLVILLGATKGLENGVKQTFSSNAQNSMQIYGGRTKLAHKGTPAGKRIYLKNSDYKSLGENFKEIEEICAMVNVPITGMISYKKNYGSFDVSAIHHNFNAIRNLDIVEGRFLNEIDISRFRKVVAIQQEAKDILFPNMEAIGEYVKINDISFKVIGVFKTNEFNDNSRDVYIPISVAQSVFTKDDKLRRISFTMGPIGLKESKKLEDKLTRRIARNHNFSTDDVNALWIRNNIENSNTFAQIFTFLKILIWVIGTFTIALGCVGVFNIMMIVVKERTREIGVRKAIGASPISVISLILFEAVFITIAAGYIGMFLGVAFLEFVIKFNIVEHVYEPAAMYFINPQVNLNIAITATLILVVIGSLAGFFPARKAALIKPIVALREE